MYRVIKCPSVTILLEVENLSVSAGTVIKCVCDDSSQPPYNVGYRGTGWKITSDFEKVYHYGNLIDVIKNFPELFL